jgi:hypothetical protein
MDSPNCTDDDSSEVVTKRRIETKFEMKKIETEKEKSKMRYVEIV